MKRLSLLVSLTLIVSVLAGCAQATPSATPTPVVVEKQVTRVVEVSKVVTATPEPKRGPVAGGNLVYALSFEPDTLDVHKSGNVFVPCQFFGAGLVARDPKTGEFVPYLAKSWTIGPNGMSYEFKLRDDVTFHNGAKLTAKDYAFTFMRAIDPKTKSPTAGQTLLGLVKAEAVDDYTLRLTMAQPNSTLLNSMSNNCYLQPLPQAAVESMGDEFGRKPIGVGPFKFKEWVTGTRIVLERNPDFKWGPSFTHGGPAYIQTITFRILPEYATQIAGLESGEVDVTDVQTKDLARIQALKKHQVIAVGVPGAGVHLEMNTTKAPFDDVRVRQAVNYALDRDQIIKIVESGIAQPLYGPITPATVGYWPGVEYVGYRFNLNQAKALMTQAGYTAGSDGILQKGGKPLATTLVFSSQDQKTAEIVQQQLKTLGIKVDLKQMEYGVLTKTLSGGDFEIGMDRLGWPDAGLLYVMFHSSTIGAYNHVRTKALDNLIIAFVVSTTTQQFNDTAGAIQKKAVEDALFAPIYAETANYAVSSRIQGPIYMPASRWLYLFDAYIETGPQ